MRSLCLVLVILICGVGEGWSSNKVPIGLEGLEKGDPIKLSFAHPTAGKQVMECDAYYDATGKILCVPRGEEYKRLFDGKPGFIWYDPGARKSTFLHASDISTILGDEGKLFYRGTSIEKLDEASFDEVFSLLVHGKEKQVKKLNFVGLPEWYQKGLQSFPLEYRKTLNPMQFLQGEFPKLRAIFGLKEEIEPEHYMAMTTALFCAAYRYTEGEEFIPPNSKRSYVENILWCTLGEEFFTHNQKNMPKIVKLFELIMILHAEHGFNASTSVVCSTASTGADIEACLSAGVGALSGESHGGANIKVVEMLERIIDMPGASIEEKVSGFMELAKSKEAEYRDVKLMGFGHRVYKEWDPRAKIIKELCMKVLSEMGIESDLFKVAQALEKAALNDEYFTKRSLFPNLDFYSGVLFTALGIPKKMFRAIFALSRTAGWIAHLKEIKEKGHSIVRPVEVTSLKKKVSTSGSRGKVGTLFTAKL